MVDKVIVSHENDLIKVKDQELPYVNMVNIVIYDDDGEPIKLDDKLSKESQSKSKLKLEQEQEKSWNVVTQVNKGILNPISIKKIDIL